MARINLLPWREERRRERQQQLFGLLLAAAVVSVLAVLAGRWYMGELVDYQQARNNYLKTEIAKLDEQIKQIEALEETRANLIASKRVIDQLQSDRAAAVHLVDQLVRTIPDGVYLTSVGQNGNTVTLEGIAISNTRVSIYQRNIDESDYFYTTRLEITEAVQREGEGRVVRFRLQASTKPPEAETVDDFEQQAVGS